MLGMRFGRVIALLCGQLTLRAALASHIDDLSFGRVIEQDARDDGMSNEIRDILDNYGMPQSARRAPSFFTANMDGSSGGAPPFITGDMFGSSRDAPTMHKMQVNNNIDDVDSPAMPWNAVPFQSEPPSPFGGSSVSFASQQANDRPRMPWEPASYDDAPELINGPSVQSLGQGQQSIYATLDQYSMESGASGARLNSRDVTYIRAPFDVGIPYIDTNRRTWVPILPTQDAAASVASVGASASGGTRIWVQAPFKIGKPNWDEKTQKIYVPYFTIAYPRPVYPPKWDDEVVDPKELVPAYPVKHPLARTREAHAEKAKAADGPVEKKSWLGWGLKRNRTRFFPRQLWSNPNFHRYHMNQPSYPFAVSYPPLRRWPSPPPMYSPVYNRWPMQPPMQPPMQQRVQPPMQQQYTDYGVDWLSDEAGR